MNSDVLTFLIIARFQDENWIRDLQNTKGEGWKIDGYVQRNIKLQSRQYLVKKLA
jgi:hypothetical protein